MIFSVKANPPTHPTYQWLKPIGLPSAQTQCPSEPWSDAPIQIDLLHFATFAASMSWIWMLVTEAR